MYFATLAFLAGVMTLPWFSTIPPLGWFFPAIILTVLFWYISCPPYRMIFTLLLIALLGCLFLLWHSEHILQWELPKNLEAKTIMVVGSIASLPKITEDEAQFEFQLESINGQPQDVRIQLSWYQTTAPLRTGDRWQFQVHLKRPHGLINPGGFDYEEWLFSRKIRATGYVIHPLEAQLLQAQPWLHPIDRFRQYIQQKIQASLGNQSTVGLITALIMGAQSGITQDQWQIMRATGTNHLMAIAGVHIAFVSGFMYALVNFLWRRSARLALRVATPQAAACGVLFIAIIYSALAGFALPTQRALIMLLVLMLGLFLRRELHAWNAFALALFLILLWDPFSTLSISFWLSFGAVFAIIYGVSGRLKPTGLWWKYIHVQWVITIALIPISLVLFQQSALVSLIANLIAVPAVGILVLPLCLIGALLLMIFPFAGHWILWFAAKSIGIIWWILAWLGSLQGAVWHQVMPNALVLIATIIAILLLLAPRGLPGRWVGVFWLFPLIFFQEKPLATGTVRFSLLDVGQGLSAVVQTQHHTLIFDTGPPMGENEDAGSRVILPFLQARGITKIDTLVVSHGDSDHIGGAFSVLEHVPVAQILTSVPERFPSQFSKGNCKSGQTWQWDGVRFRMLYPPPELAYQGNNSSCVLRIETLKGTILLTGDIEKPAEEYLLKQARTLLAATLLVAPHHGSRTSSTFDFIQAVKPLYVLFPVGYKNRYHFPDPLVLERYQKAGAMMFDTDQSGTVMADIGVDNTIEIKTQRGLDGRVWYGDVVSF